MRYQFYLIRAKLFCFFFGHYATDYEPDLIFCGTCKRWIRTETCGDPTCREEH